MATLEISQPHCNIVPHGESLHPLQCFLAAWYLGVTQIYCSWTSTSRSLKHGSEILGCLFIVAAVTISEIWNQPRSSPIDEQIRKMGYMYREVLVKKDIMWLTRKYMQLEIIILSKESKMKRYKHDMLPLICGL